MCLAEFEQIERPGYVGVNINPWVLHGLAHPSPGSQINYSRKSGEMRLRIGSLCQVLYRQVVGNIQPGELEARPIEQPGEAVFFHP